ncbi:hypothetical protein H7H82_15115 [Mycobacterium heidelbergense]|uniref:hypothetical protein n=1 Tax=Mycobacterium heidelbergense TaxID=53376 RepID=UPI00114D9B6E|nr:hypothetical protein [Mycobacterium heidelbergense]MCV7051906.1 hypothetical protein [Mycobacterium heidelbergense]BBZ49101.1 hypothetical protein MHEI_08180 [Mycobacterium heidelbergense]
MTNVDRSDHHKHMDYVQDVISRLANNSFLTKGWAITLASALLGFAATQKQAGLALAAFVPTIALWFLDTYFLRLERAFRDMYDDVAAKRVRDFKIHPGPYLKKQPWTVALAVSLRIFYPTILALATAVAIILAVATNSPAAKEHPPSPGGPAATSGAPSAPGSSSPPPSQPPTPPGTSETTRIGQPSPTPAAPNSAPETSREVAPAPQR